MTRKIEVSSKTIVFTVFFILGLWFLFQIRTLIIMLFVSFILMTALNPLVKAAKKIKIPALLTVMVLFLLIIIIVTGSIASLTPSLIRDTKGLVEQLPAALEEFNNNSFLKVDEELFSTQIANLPSNVIKIASGAISNVFSLMVIFFMTYYLILDRDHLHEYLMHFLGDGDAEKRAEKFIYDLEKKIGSWIRGQAFLMFFIGFSTYAGLMLLQIPYALPLAILAGLLEIVPNIGPTIAAIPAILVGLTVSPVTALGVTAFAILIQQLESNLIVPKVMEKAVGTRPLTTIIVLITGFTIAGALGAVLAMPIYLVIDTLLHTS